MTLTDETIQINVWEDNQYLTWDLIRCLFEILGIWEQTHDLDNLYEFQNDVSHFGNHTGFPDHDNHVV